MKKLVLNPQTAICLVEDSADKDSNSWGKGLNLLNPGNRKFSKEEEADFKFLLMVLSALFLGVSFTGSCFMLLIKLLIH